MNDLATLTRLIENLIRLGTITEIQMKPPRVRVKTSTLTTGWLPWIAPHAGADREWNPPTVGEQVILLSPSGQLGNGVVFTGLFSDQIPLTATAKACTAAPTATAPSSNTTASPTT